MLRLLKLFFTYQACADEIKVTVVDGSHSVADLNSLAMSKVVKQQVKNAKYYVNP
jgi:hypothetical protein